MMENTSPDRSHGYEALAKTFMRIRNRRIGPAVVRERCLSLPSGAEVLDLGCGSGVPISEVLVEAGFAVFGVDASLTMIRAFQERFPRRKPSAAQSNSRHSLPRLLTRRSRGG